MRTIKYLILCTLLITAFYGAGRLYYRVTGGFTVSNITYPEIAYDARWETTPLTADEKHEVRRALSQDYYYLGKGCQSYVFVSEDAKTVIKFPKYQRFRPQEWVSLFSWVPGIPQYQKERAAFRRGQMEKMFRGWVLGYEDLKSESGVMYVHMNKAPGLPQSLVLHDKMGYTHTINPEQFEFLLQKRAVMLDKTIEQCSTDEGETLIDRILAMIVSEYYRGLADNDHALVQNTGIVDGRPIHIDVGQFIRNRGVMTPEKHGKELFNKTFRMREWLEEEYPQLAEHLKSRLVTILGVDYYYFPPYVYRPHFGKLPDDDFTSP